jgi:hypothetical protein
MMLPSENQNFLAKSAKIAKKVVRLNTVRHHSRDGVCFFYIRRMKGFPALRFFLWADMPSCLNRDLWDYRIMGFLFLCGYSCTVRCMMVEFSKGNPLPVFDTDQAARRLPLSKPASPGG